MRSSLWGCGCVALLLVCGCAATTRPAEQGRARARPGRGAAAPGFVLLPSHADRHRVRVPTAWQVTPPPSGQTSGWLALIRPAGAAARCANLLWYTFAQGADPERTAALVERGELPGARAAPARARAPLARSSIRLGHLAAVGLTPADQRGRFRSTYLVSFEPGVLVIQCSTVGRLEGEERCARQHGALAALLAASFERSPEGLTLAGARGACP